MNKFRKPHGNGGGSGGSRFGGGRGPGRPGFNRSPRPQFGGPRKEGVELFDAVCSKCGKDCQVPFRPNGQKPVYCRACFGIPALAPAGRENFVRRDAPATSFESHEPHGPRVEDREIAELKQQIGVMNSKMDSILRMLNSLPRTVAPVAAATPVTPATPVVRSGSEVKEAVQKALSKKKIVKKKVAAKKK